MALVKCADCGKEVSENAPNCPNCGAPIASKAKDVMIRFPVYSGQLFNNGVYIYDKKTGDVIAQGKQGETLTFDCTSPREIYVYVKGSFGKPEATVNPGDRYEVAYRNMGKIYLEKVDSISGQGRTGGGKLSFGIMHKF